MNEAIKFILEQIKTEIVNKQQISETVESLRACLKDLDTNFGFLPEEPLLSQATRNLLACALKIITKKNQRTTPPQRTRRTLRLS